MDSCNFFSFHRWYEFDNIEFLNFERFPFDATNPIGYICAVTLQYIMLARNFLFVSVATSYGIGVFLYIRTITEDIKHCLKSMNIKAKSKKNELYALEMLKNSIQLHSKAKQLSKSWLNQYCMTPTTFQNSSVCKFRLVRDYADIYQCIFMCTYLWSLATICAALLMFSIELVHYSI